MRSFLLILQFALICTHVSAAAPSVSILAPRNTPISQRLADGLQSELSSKFNTLDREMAAAAFRSLEVEDPFNLSISQARQLGNVIGANYLVLIKADTVRRTSLERGSYFESYAAFYVVESRTGNLIDWSLHNETGPDEATTAAVLLQRVKHITGAIAERIIVSESIRSMPPSPKPFKILTDKGSDSLVKPPIPYRRIRPEYSQQAFLYGISGTVDLEADIDENGNVVRTDVTRWLGFGLDESAISAVRQMNWRPAELKGKFLPTRVLLRYNFRKIDKESNVQ
jgi:TonB family protein